MTMKMMTTKTMVRMMNRINIMDSYANVAQTYHLVEANFALPLVQESKILWAQEVLMKFSDRHGSAPRF